MTKINDYERIGTFSSQSECEQVAKLLGDRFSGIVFRSIMNEATTWIIEVNTEARTTEDIEYINGYCHGIKATIRAMKNA